MNNRGIQILKNGGLFVLLLALTFYIILKDNSPSQILDAVSHVQVSYILFGICAMAVFLCCEALNIARCLKLFGYETSSFSALKYAAVGFFFSSITPSASGGQPMQVYYMYKDHIEVSHSTLALLFELLSFETVTVTLSVIGFFYQKDIISASMGNLQYLLLIGLGLNLIVMLLLIMAIFSKKAIKKAAAVVVKLVSLFSRSRGEALEELLTQQIAEYQQSARYFKENKVIFAKTLATTFVQILSMYSIPFLIYKGFGLGEFNAAEVISLQAVLYVAVSALPLPGALGVSESAFMILFRTLFPAGILSSAMVLSRGISFYLFVLLTGLCVAGGILIKKKGAGYGLYNTHC